MPAGPFENTVVRYAASFLVVLAAVVLGTAAALAVPERLAYHHVLRWAAIVVAATLGIAGMVRIEEGPGSLSRRLRSLRP